MRAIAFFLFLTVASISESFCKTRIKDVSTIAGVRENFLVGCGLVAGLQGTGDNLRNSAFTKDELSNLLEKLGISTRGANLKTKNIACVVVTASLPPFAKPGSKIDVKVSALGDCSSLASGTLLPTPLFGPNGVAYAVAQGLISVQKFTPGSAEVKTKQAEMMTNGSIAQGAIVEKDLGFSMQQATSLQILLHCPDFANARRIEEAINDSIPGNLALAADSGSVTVSVPQERRGDVVGLIAELEAIEVDTDSRAVVALNEVTGTIVVGSKVKIKPVAIAHGNLVVEIGGPKLDPSSPKYRRLQDELNKSRGSGMVAINDTATLGDLVSAVNKLGVLPKDLIDIIKCIKAAGALDAALEIQ